MHSFVRFFYKTATFIEQDEAQDGQGGDQFPIDSSREEHNMEQSECPQYFANCANTPDSCWLYNVFHITMFLLPNDRFLPNMLNIDKRKCKKE